MTRKRGKPRSGWKPWAYEIEAELQQLRKTKRQLEDAVGVDYSTIYQWFKQDLTPARRSRIEEAMAGFRNPATGQPLAGGFVGMIRALEEIHARSGEVLRQCRALVGDQVEVVRDSGERAG